MRRCGRCPHPVGGATLLLFLALPLAFVLPGRSLWERARLLGLVGLVALVGMAPWIAFNMARFDKPVFLASGSGRVLAYANCDRTYGGDFLGYWHSDCTLQEFPEGDESIIDEAHRELAQDYVEDHLGEQPKVVAARVGRIWVSSGPSRASAWTRSTSAGGSGRAGSRWPGTTCSYPWAWPAWSRCAAVA